MSCAFEPIELPLPDVQLVSGVPKVRAKRTQSTVEHPCGSGRAAFRELELQLAYRTAGDVRIPASPKELDLGLCEPAVLPAPTSRADGRFELLDERRRILEQHRLNRLRRHSEGRAFSEAATKFVSEIATKTSPAPSAWPCARPS
jgi:hypothetical protein